MRVGVRVDVRVEVRDGFLKVAYYEVITL